MLCYRVLEILDDPFVRSAKSIIYNVDFFAFGPYFVFVAEIIDREAERNRQNARNQELEPRRAGCQTVLDEDQARGDQSTRCARLGQIRFQNRSSVMCDYKAFGFFINHAFVTLFY